MRTSEISLVELEHNLAAIIRRVAAGDERVMVLTESQPTVVVISIEEFRFLEQLRARQTLDPVTRQAQEEAWLTQVKQLQADILKRAGGPLPDSVAELNELREERTDEILGLR